MSDAMPANAMRASEKSCGSDADADADALQLSPKTMSSLFEDLPRACGVQAALRILDVVRQSLLGDGLMTVTAILNTPPGVAPSDVVDLQRIWSSNPDAYPVAGLKRKTLTPWTRQLVQRGEVFVGEGNASLVDVFDDHVRIIGLGLHAVINVPLLTEGRCVAIFNVLGTRARWRPHEVHWVLLLANLSKPSVLPEVASMDQKVIA